MNLRNKVALVFLILGFIFSCIIRVRFNIAHGFEFHNFWITWMPSFFDFALLSSNEHALTTTFLGYAFFAISGLLMLNYRKALRNNNKSLLIFMGLTAFALLFEVISLAQDFFTSYYGQHLRMGLLLFLLGIVIFSRIYHSPKFINTFDVKQM